VDVFKTKELWGVGDTAPYLHDGGAPTLDAAIRMHGGAPRTDLTVAVDPPVPLGGARFALPIRITNRGAQPAAVQRLHLVAMQAPQGAAIEGADGPNGPGAVLHLSAGQAPGSVPPALLSGLAPGQTGILWAFVNRPAALPGA
ncbi:MAG: hypothetical protein NTZ05_08815, partial [Chloroflexi bacterium]|nr:hypothetical protein [Chloroflexota bacterium]